MDIQEKWRSKEKKVLVHQVQHFNYLTVVTTLK